MHDIIDLPDAEIIERTKILCAKERLITAKILLYIAAFDDRRLYAKKAYPSMFQYLVSEMHYSEGAASRRLTSARLIKLYPALISMIEEGALHLSALHKLSNYADRSDFMEIVKRARGRTRRSLEELLAQITGKVPVQKESVRVFAVKKKAVKRTAHSEPTTPASPESATTESEPVKQEPQAETSFELNARISVAIDAETYADLMRAKEILGHTALADVLKDALKVLLDKKDPKRKAERMEKAAAKCSEKTEKPEETKPSTTSNPRIPSTKLKRTILQRDGWQCVYVDPDTGKRCCATTNLHVDHVTPYAAGGATSEDNLRILCFQHNRLAAEEWFGKEKIGEKIKENRSSRV